jgi:hypothetical protein
MGSVNDLTTSYATVPASVAGVSLGSEQRHANLLKTAVSSITRALNESGSGATQAITGGVVLESNITTQTFNCTSGGTLTRTIYDYNNNASDLMPNDGIQLTFTNCVEPGVPTQNGTMALFLISATNAYFNFDGTPWGDPWNFTFTLSFTDYKLTNSSTSYSLYNGEVDLHAESDATNTGNNHYTAHMSGVELNETYLAGSTLYDDQWMNFNFVNTTYDDGSIDMDEDFTLASTSIGGIVMVNTGPVAHFGPSDNYPVSGVIVISGANGSAGGPTRLRLEFDASGSGYWKEVDADGDGIYDAAAAYVAW